MVAIKLLLMTVGVVAVVIAVAVAGFSRLDKAVDQSDRQA